MIDVQFYYPLRVFIFNLKHSIYIYLENRNEEKKIKICDPVRNWGKEKIVKNDGESMYEEKLIPVLHSKSEYQGT